MGILKGEIQSNPGGYLASDTPSEGDAPSTCSLGASPPRTKSGCQDGDRVTVLPTPSPSLLQGPLCLAGGDKLSVPSHC